MKPVNLGVIGCGIAAKELHLPALKSLGGKFTITMACNRSPGKAKEYSDLAGGVPYVTDYRTVLDNSDVEAVSIALPFHLNPDVTRDALDAGKHVIVEKPLASTLDDAKQMVELEKRYGHLVTMIAENFRYRPLYRRVKELVTGNYIGKPYHIMWNYFFFVDPETNKYAGTPWRMGDRYPGGFIVDAGVHNIAVIRILFGEFKKGRGLIRGVTPELGRYDTLSYQFIMESGIGGVLNLFYSSKGMRANTIHIFGDAGTIIVERDRLTVKKENEKDHVEDYPDDMGYLKEFENFYEAVRTGEKIISTFEEGCRDFEVIDNAVRVSIDERNNESE